MEQDSQRTLRIPGRRRCPQLKDVVARTVAHRPQHQLRGDAFAVGKQYQLVEFLIGGKKIPLDAIDDQLRRLGFQVEMARVGARAQPSRQRRGFDRTNRHPNAVLLHRTDPWSVAGLSIEFVGDHQTQHVGGRTRRNVDERGRTLVGFAVRHAQFEQTTLGKQRKRLRGLPDHIPIERALDEKDPAVRIACRACRSPDRIGSLTHQQRLVAGHEINAGQAPPESLFELVVGNQRQRIRARAASYSAAIRSTRTPTGSMPRMPLTL